MGFDTDIFIHQPVDENLLCLVCHAVQEIPVTVCNQGHTLCEACFATWEQRSNVCPTCRSPLSGKILNRPIQNIIQSLQLRCPAASVQEGGPRCGWEGTMSEFVERHRTQECPLRKIQCSNEGCGEMVQHDQLEDHEQSSCPHRIISCQLCGEEMRDRERFLHDMVSCPEVICKCNFCDESMPRKLLGEHPRFPLADCSDKYTGHYMVCPRALVRCDFEGVGCLATLKREDLNGHHVAFAKEHAALVSKKFQTMEQEKRWSSCNIQWTIPEAILQRANQTQDAGHLVQSQRIQVGEYLVFLRLSIINTTVCISVCVESLAFAPYVDNVSVHVIDGSLDYTVWRRDTEERLLTLDDTGTLHSSFFLDCADGALINDEDTMNDDEEEGEHIRDARIEDLIALCRNGNCIVRTQFRLRRPDVLSVGCQP